MNRILPVVESGQELEPVRLRTYGRRRADTAAVWALRVYRDLARSHRLFVSPLDRAIWFVPDAPDPPRRLETVADFAGNIVFLADFVENPQEEGSAARPLKNEDASLLFHCEARRLLPPVRAVLTRPVLLPTETGGARLTPIGYDPVSQIFLAPGPASTGITPDERGLEALERAFSGVPFARPEFRANLFAWMLGATLFDPEMTSPLLVTSANHAQVGKSITTICAIRILSGSAPQAIGQSPDEFEKRVGAQFLRNERFIFIDNVESRRTQAYTNANLSFLITEPGAKAVRELGVSKMVSQMHVQFAITANRCMLAEDLALRSLAVKLFRESYAKMEPYVLDEVSAHLNEIYAGLLWLGLQPAPKYGRPAPSWRHLRWLDFVGPRIESRWGPLSLEAALTDFDTEAIELYSLGAEHLGENLTPQQILDLIMGVGGAGLVLGETGLRPTLQDKSPKAQHQYICSKLRYLEGKRYSDPEGSVLVLTLTHEGDSHSSPTYQFSRL